MLVLEKTNPENLTNSAIETELKYLWEQVINLEIAVSVIRDCDVELDKFNIRKNLYNQQSEKDNEIYLIKERIADPTKPHTPNWNRPLANTPLAAKGFGAGMFKACKKQYSNKHPSLNNIRLVDYHVVP